MGTYLGAAWGYNSPAAGECSDGLESLTEWCDEGAQGALRPLLPAGGLYRRVPSCPRTYGRRDPVCSPSIPLYDVLW